MLHCSIWNNPLKTITALQALKWRDWPVDKIARNIPFIQLGNIERLLEASA